MRFYSISLFVVLVAILITGCKDKAVKGISCDQNFYSGCPQYSTSESFNLKSSLIENPEEATLKAPPCLMTMRVHQNFLEGYRDNLNGHRARIRNRTQEYVNGYNLAADDIQKGICRKLEAISIR